MNAAEWELMLKARDMLVNAPHGTKAEVTTRAAQMLGCSVATVYRKLEQAGLDLGRKRRSDAGNSAVSVDDLKLLSATLLASRRDNDKQLWSGKRAVSALRANGLISTGLSSARLLTKLRDHQLHVEQMSQPRNATTMQTPHPNFLWQIDSSTSVLYKDKTGRLRSMSTDEFYKNKPQNFARVVNDLITRYLAVDHASGNFKGRYYLGGESAENLIDFFIYCVTKQGDSPMHGVPLHVYTDQGSGNKAGLWLNFAKNLGVTLLRHEPGRANATGSVEKHGDIWERNFEGGFPFMDPATITLDWLNVAGPQWAAVHCATERHTRHGMTRDAAWLLIKEAELRIPTSVELLRELAYAEPMTRRVSNTLTVSVSIKGFGAQTYNLRDVPGASAGVKVTLTINAYRAPAIDVHEDGAAGTVLHTVAPEIVNQFGFPIDAPTLGQSFRPAAYSQAEHQRNELLRETYRQKKEDGADGQVAALPTLEEAQKLRKKHAQALGGRLDPMADIHAAELPTYMPRRGTELAATAAAGATRRTVDVVLSVVDAAKRLKAMLGEAYGPHVYAWLVQRFPEGVPEAQLEGIAQQFQTPAAATGTYSATPDAAPHAAPHGLRVVTG